MKGEDRGGSEGEGEWVPGRERGEGRGPLLLILDTPLLLYDYSDILLLVQGWKTVIMKLALIKLKNYVLLSAVLEIENVIVR